MRILDNYDLWEAHEREQQKKLAELPVCAVCGEPVQDDHFYLINDEVICPECLDAEFRKETEDFMGMNHG